MNLALRDSISNEGVVIPFIFLLGRTKTVSLLIESVNLLMETYCASPRVGVAFHYDVKKHAVEVSGSAGILIASHVRY